MKSKILVLIAMIAVGASLAVAADPAYGEHDLRGTVVSVDRSTRTIVVRADDGATKTFTYDSQLDLLNIGQNDYVSVRYNLDPSGGMMAMKVDETSPTASGTTYGTQPVSPTGSAYDNPPLRASNELPNTASPLPLLALLGLGSLTGGTLLRRRRNR